VSIFKVVESYVEVYFVTEPHLSTLCCLVKMCATTGTLCIRCTFRLIIVIFFTYKRFRVAKMSFQRSFSYEDNLGGNFIRYLSLRNMRYLGIPISMKFFQRGYVSIPANISR